MPVVSELNLYEARIAHLSCNKNKNITHGSILGRLWTRLLRSVVDAAGIWVAVGRVRTLLSFQQPCRNLGKMVGTDCVPVYILELLHDLSVGY